MKTNLLLTATILVVSAGCTFGPLKGGWGAFRAAPVFEGVVQQPQNPKDESTQDYEKVTKSPDGSVVTESVKTKIGAAQKDTAREMAAKLSSLKGLVWLGAAVFLFGVASAFWAPLKLVVGSMTTSLMIAAAGLALVVLPSLVVGNEILIAAVALGGAALWWFSHRHGELRGKVKVLEEK